MSQGRQRPRVAIVGAPNVGKSTLFNRLLGRRRALVADHPGLTRDTIEADGTLGGVGVTLADTGGLMPPGSVHLAQEIRQKVLEATRAADLLLFVVDARRGPGVLEEELATLFRKAGRPLVLVVNKVDGPDPDRTSLHPFSSLGFETVVPLSAEHALGLADLHLICAGLLPRGGEASASAEAVEVAIAGRPNVGKSSLLNALLKQDRSLVSGVPGTTRDTVDAEIPWREKVFRLVDTAGMRRPGRVERGPETLSVGAARRALRRSALTLIVLDGAEGLVAQDMSLLGMVAGGRSAWLRPAMVLVNKIDLLEGRRQVDDRVRQVRERLKFARFVPVLAVSALKGTNLDSILPAVERVLAESARLISTNELNDWLRSAASSHPHPVRSGRRLSLVFVTQSGTSPPKFTFLTNHDMKPHFSYVRYLENSLRARFDLRATPVILRFRHRAGGRPGRRN